MEKVYDFRTWLCRFAAAGLFISSQALAQVPVIHSPVVELADTGFVFTEGPLWNDSLGLLFSDVRGNTVYQYLSAADSSRVFLTPSGNSNGLKWDKTGALLLAQHGKRRIARISNGGETEVASLYKGKRLNSPNDLTVKSDGSILFTDPPYGITPAEAELPYSGVFRVNPQGKLILLDSTITTPNGIVFSPDERVLYVNNSANRTIYSWDVTNDSVFTNKKVFANVSGSAAGNADGMTVDSLGNVYSTGSGGIWIIAPNGTVLDTILIPGQLTNVAFGGRNRDTLYITAATKLYKVYNGSITGLQDVQTEFAQAVFSVYPNPAVSNVNIPVSMSKPGNVQLQVLNLQGQVVATLAEGAVSEGNHHFTWDAAGKEGIYFIRLVTNAQSSVKTCMISGK